RAPRLGAKLEKHDAESIRSRPGVVAVVEIDDGLIVIARSWWQARRALDDAKLTWTAAAGEGFTSAAFDRLCTEKMASGPFFTHLQQGDDAAPDGATRLEATYHLPFQAHATMEPMNCTAHVADGRCGIWAPTQGMELAQTVAAQVTGLPPERITIHRTML